jgi:hypothetical protein
MRRDFLIYLPENEAGKEKKAYFGRNSRKLSNIGPKGLVGFGTWFPTPRWRFGQMQSG